MVARSMHNTLKVFALCLVRVSCSRPNSGLVVNLHNL